MKYLIKSLKIIVPVLALFYSIGCTKVDDANRKFPQIIPGFTNTFDSTTGTATFVNTSKNGSNYFWNFGDNYTSTQQNPVHSYTKSGNYSVVLTVSNSAGAIDSITKMVNVAISMPAVLLPVSLPITFDAITVNYASNFISTSLPVTLITNPQLSGSNNSATKVASITNAGVSGENFGVKLNPGVDITTKKSFTIDVYSTVAIPVRLQLDGGTAPNPQNTQTHAGSGWQTLTFTVSGTGIYTNFYLYFGTGSTAGTFYVDNIMQVPTVAPPPSSFNGGLLKNGDFSDATSAPWTVGVSSTLAPTTSMNGNTYYSQDVTTAGNVYDVDASQTGLRIVQDSTYTLTFVAWSSVNRSIVAGIGLSGGSFSNTAQTVNITPTHKTYTLTLTATGWGDPANSRVLFDIGGAVGTVNIDSVSLFEVASAPPRFNGGLIINGDFQATTSAPWSIGVSTNLAPVVTMNGNTYYSQNVTAAGNVYDVDLSQTGIRIVQDSVYTLTFDAWSDVNRSIVAGIGLSGGSFANTAQTQNITTKRTTYTLTLTATGWGDLVNSRVLFDIGGAVGLVNIDNVSLFEVAGTSGGGGGGCTGTPVAATAFPVDFEGCQTFLSSNNFGAGITTSVVANPDKSGINTSSYVLQIDKPTGSDFYAGIQNPFASDLDLTKPFKMKIYSKKAGVVFNIGVNNNPDKPGVGLPGPQYVTVATANVWTEVSIQFTGLPPGATANQLYIKPDDPAGDPAITAGSTYFIDDITQ